MINVYTVVNHNAVLSCCRAPYSPSATSLNSTCLSDSLLLSYCLFIASALQSNDDGKNNNIPCSPEMIFVYFLMVQHSNTNHTNLNTTQQVYSRIKISIDSHTLALIIITHAQIECQCSAAHFPIAAFSSAENFYMLLLQKIF